MAANTTNLRFGNVNHINYPNKRGEIYCRAVNKIIKMSSAKCGSCPLLSGSAQGEGVECYYYDAIFKGDVEPIINSPEDEQLRISQLIDHKIIDKKATRK